MRPVNGWSLISRRVITQLVDRFTKFIIVMRMCTKLLGNYSALDALAPALTLATVRVVPARHYVGKRLKDMEAGTAAFMEVSSKKWKESSIHGIKLAQAIIERSDGDVKDARLTDPLPLLRDACARHTNDKIYFYARNTRDVVGSLRRAHVAVNAEIKSANRCKEKLEKALEHKRKDLLLNQDSQDIRSHRPSREQGRDGAEQLLKSERTHLLTLKTTLESHLSIVKQQLQNLNTLRCSFASVLQERSHATDLLCQFMNGSSGKVGTLSSVSVQKFPQSSLPPLYPGSTSRLLAQDGQTPLAYRSAKALHSKAYSAPIPLDIGKGLDATANGMERSASEAELIGPYSAMSPEAACCLEEASNTIQKSRAARQAANAAVEHTHYLQQLAHDSVNEGITRKLAQTVTLKQHLEHSSGETRLALQRSQRQGNAQTKALGYMLGPVSSNDVTTRERLTRPNVEIYQRHFGTDLPDAAHLIKATQHYQDSIDATMKNMALLKLAEKGLRHDIKDKKAAATLDSHVVRFRRRKGNHRWALQGKACYHKP